MKSMFPAERAVLLRLHAVRMQSFFLRQIVVPVLAFCACQCDLCAHSFHLTIFCIFVFFFCLKISIKKRPHFRRHTRISRLHVCCQSFFKQKRRPAAFSLLAAADRKKSSVFLLYKYVHTVRRRSPARSETVRRNKRHGLR